MAADRPAAYDRVHERRRAVALARHLRDAEGLSVAQIAERLGRSPATIKAHFYDPTGETGASSHRVMPCPSFASTCRAIC
jgi:DNA-binding NarL/FixJ family response regulator